ncbi:Nramp-domain-containing protein [Pholiota conissans]|uniref:Nramp-domain-containing protein n=1 Tax=Pholiota conissans TaxID=109636 RepID=A0A9P5Z266_9AGAR|nr:Nramp-domain-containing protein [Pholiota conissans]
MTDAVSTPTGALLPRNSKPTIAHRVRRAGGVVIHHAKKHTGVGIVCAVAYFDPGNWGVDLQAGSEFGYRLLFVVLLAGLFAVYLQVLATRLGCVTGIDLASHSRLLLYNRPKHTRLYRWLGLYPLYVLAEVAIIATDLAELLGSAIAMSMLFPQLELWQGVLITAFDVLLVFAMGDPLRGRPVKMFELLIAALVLAVLICMIVIISKVDVNWGDAFVGYVPSKYIFASGGVYTSVGILGATVMPHSLFLGSALATQDRISFRGTQNVSDLTPVNSKESEESLPAKLVEETSFVRRLYEYCKESVLAAFRRPPPSCHSSVATSHSEHRNNPLEFVRAHLYHGTFDVVGSLLGFAVMINSLILMLAAAVFFYGTEHTNTDGPASLFDAYDLIRDLVGQPAATLFAIALLCAGQSSSIIATVAGQAVSEGFIQWRVSPVMRRLATRLLAIIPSMAVAIIVGRKGIDTLLVTSQVVLSIVLPFITFPLLYCTSNKAIMTVRRTGPSTLVRSETASSETLAADLQSPGLENRSPDMTENADTDEVVDYSNNRLTIYIGVAIWLVIVAANFYVIVELGLGKGM